MSRRVVLASGNAGKLREMRDLLAPLGLTIESQGDLGIDSADETGLSFVENAILKARHVARCSGRAAIADDSGLEVDALGGAPGIYSARYAGPEQNDDRNNARLLEALDEVADDERSARFQCVVVHLRHAEDPSPLICQGTWEGRILRAPRGEHGFGYDPLFLPDDAPVSAAELAPADKNRLSHRARAMHQLVERLRHHLG